MKRRKKITRSIEVALKNFFLGIISLDELESHLKGVYYQYPTLEESIETPEAPRMNFCPEAAAVQSQSYATPDIFTLALNGIYFCPEHEILHTKSNRLIEESISTQKDLREFNLKAFYIKKEAKISEFCSIFRSRKNGYYHTLIDNLPRLYLLNHPQFREIDEIKLLCCGQPTKVEQFYLDRLLPENVRVVPVDKNKRYLLDNLIFPSFLSRRFSGYLPSEYRTWFIDKVAPKRPRQKINRIFISRIATHKGRQRCILNEDELFERLQPQGFKRYVLEHLTIKEQIALFYDAETVVAAHGAGLTNTIFSHQIKVLELFPTAFVLPHYYFLARSLGHSYRYWCAQDKSLRNNFSVDISEILKALESFSIMI